MSSTLEPAGAHKQDSYGIIFYLCIYLFGRCSQAGLVRHHLLFIFIYLFNYLFIYLAGAHKQDSYGIIARMVKETAVWKQTLEEGLIN